MANKYKIKLIVPLTDGYQWFNGNYGHFCPSGVGKDQFWTDAGARANFKRAISQWLNHVNQFTGVPIKNDPGLFLIELGNELGNIRPDSGSNTVPTREWIEDITNYIKTIDRNHLVLNGADESLGQSDEFNIQSLDCYSSHFYGKDYSRIDRDANRAAAVAKPYIIGEYDSKWGNDWFGAIEARPNVKGTFAWSLYPHQGGYLTGAAIAHDDGFTLHYPEDNGQLQLMAAHFNRMKAGTSGGGGSSPPPPINACTKCNIAVEQGGCKCDNNCNCLNVCDKCNVAVNLGGCKCDSNCNCLPLAAAASLEGAQDTAISRPDPGAAADSNLPLPVEPAQPVAAATADAGGDDVVNVGDPGQPITSDSAVGASPAASGDTSGTTDTADAGDIAQGG